MFSARWAHRSLLGICIFVILIVAGYAAWEGAFGPLAQDWTRVFVDPALDRFPQGEKLERIARVLGAVGTVMTATFGIYKAVYYADRNLPERLVQLLSWSDQRLLAVRPPLLAAIAERRPPSATQRGSLFFVAPLNRALKQIGFNNHIAARSSLNAAMDELNRQLEVSDRQRRSFEEQKVAAHILRGSITSARTEFEIADGFDPEKGRLAAEHEFSQALALRPKDMDALELRGRQRILMQNVPGALDDLERLCKVAQTSNLPVRLARAHRLVGEVLAGDATVAGRNQARRRLLTALEQVQGIGHTLGREERKERGQIHLALGSLQYRMKRLKIARRSLSDAIADLSGTGEVASAHEAKKLVAAIDAEKHPV